MSLTKIPKSIIENSKILTKPDISDSTNLDSSDKIASSKAVKNAYALAESAQSFKITEDRKITSVKLNANSTYTIPTYVVGRNAVELFLDGVYCQQGDDFVYSEVGTTGNYSTTIKFNVEIPVNTEIIVRVSNAANEQPAPDNTVGTDLTARSQATSALEQATAANQNVSNLSLEVVKLSGRQTIEGEKSFTSPITGSLNGNATTANTATTAGTAGKATQDGNGNNIVNTYAPLISPNLTGIPTAPTPSTGTNTTQIATTAFVNSAISSGKSATTGKFDGNRSITVQDSDGTNSATAVNWDGSGALTLKLPSKIKASITGNCSGSAGSCTGNAATATKLETARNIGGVSFDGSTDINLPGVNTAGNQNTSGKANTAGTADQATKVTHNVSTGNATYPVLLSGTANATANQTVTPIFASSVKVNPSTGILTASGFSGPLTGNVTGNCTGSAGSCTGNAATSSSSAQLTTARTIDGISFNGTANITNFTTCSTAAATAAKTADLTGFTLGAGARVIVKFTVTNTAANPTLNVNSTGAKAIQYRGSAITAGYLAANRTYEFVYDGTNYQLVGDIDTNSDTHWTTHLYVGASNGNANAATTNDNTYLIVCDNTTARDRRKIAGSGGTTVSSDSSGNITINSTELTAADKDITISTAIAVNGTLTVPSYLVGKGYIQLWYDGVYLPLYNATNAPNGCWQEVGTAGNASTSVKFLIAIPKNTIITARVWTKA